MIVSVKPLNSGFWSHGATRITRSSLITLCCALMVFCAVGCGGSAVAPPPTPPGPGTTVSVNLPPSISAAAVQTGTEPFTSVAAQGGQFSFTVPGGTSKYAVAYVCVQTFESGELFNTFVIEATTQDGTSLTAPCFGGVTFGDPSLPTLGSATGTLDATIFPAFLNVFIAGKQETHDNASVSGPFDARLPVGTNDIAFVVLDNFGNQALLGTAQGVKIFRDQTVPGAVNGGSTITFGSGDMPSSQLLTINPPPGFFSVPLLTEVDYTTANGTVFPLVTGFVGGYPTVPAGAAQSGDFYSFGASAETAASDSAVGLYQPTSGGGGPLTLNLPDPWISSNPTVTGSSIVFSFNYPGFSGIPVIAQSAEIKPQILTSSTDTAITVTATANFQNGASIMPIPDVSRAGPEFFKCCPSGFSFTWSASILGVTKPLNFLPDNVRLMTLGGALGLPLGISTAYVQNAGSFTAP